MDGPAHLYNATLLNQISGSEFLQGFYEKNVFFIPNRLSHFILSGLFNVFGPITSEKILFSFIVLGLPLSFRAAVKELSGNTILSFLIFPLVFSRLFHFGMFNFSLAFILFNIQLILTNRFLNGASVSKAIFFSLNSCLLFFAHGFVFGFTLISVFLLTILRREIKFGESIKSLTFFLLLFLPSLTLFFLFSTKISIMAFNTDLDSAEKCKQLLTFSPGIIFSPQNELQYSCLIPPLFIGLVFYVMSLRWNSAVRSGFLRIDFFIFLSVILFCLVFYVSNGMLGGMLIDRLLYLAFYFCAFWLCCFKYNSKRIVVFSLIVILYSSIQLAISRNEVIYAESKNSEAIIEAGKHIKDRSIIYSVDFACMFYREHYANYLGLSKEVVITENYEATQGWFPMLWKKKIKDVIMPEKKKEGTIWPDYICVYGDQNILKKEENKELKNFIDSSTVKCYQSENKFCVLYKLNEL